MATSEAARLSGIDVSHFQGDIDWEQVRGVGICFAFIETTEGIGLRDGFFKQNWRNTKRAGVLRGACHVFRPQLDPIAQAQVFLESLDDDPGELPPVLGVEILTDCAPDTVLAGAQTWLHRVHAELHRKPVLYTGYAFWRRVLKNSTLFSEYPLWIAHYTTASNPVVPSAWATWAFWQFSKEGRVAGITGDVDLDVFNGDPTDLEAFCLPATANVKDGVPA